LKFVEINGNLLNMIEKGIVFAGWRLLARLVESGSFYFSGLFDIIKAE